MNVFMRVYNNLPKNRLNIIQSPCGCSIIQGLKNLPVDLKFVCKPEDISIQYMYLEISINNVKNLLKYLKHRCYKAYGDGGGNHYLITTLHHHIKKSI